jgi:4-alpha-glucanotransferase
MKREIFRLPSTWPEISVATNGTHDTDTSAEWYDGLDAPSRELLATIPGLEVMRTHEKFDDAVRDALLEVLYAAPSRLVLVPYQDLLGDRERVNVPGTVTSENWTYRTARTLAELLADTAAADRLHRLAETTGRLPAALAK